MFRVIAAAALAAAATMAAVSAAAGATISIVSLQYSKAHPVPHFRYDGGTEAGDLARLQELYDQYVRCRNECATETGRATAVVTLRGPGGDYHEGLALADYFRANNIATVVEKGAECYSACAFSFLGGTGYSSFDRIGAYIDRMIEPGGIVGFHAPYRDEASLRAALEARSATQVLGESRNSLSLMVKELIKWNVDPEIVHYMLNMGPDQTYNVVAADDYYLTRSALPPVSSATWISDIPSAVRNACIRLLALFEHADPLDLKDRITSPYEEGIGTTQFGGKLSGYRLSDRLLDVGHCSATEESIATGTNLQVSLYMNPGLDGSSSPMLSFFNRDDYFSSAGIGASPLKRVYQRGGMGHWFLPVGINIAALETTGDLMIQANRFFTVSAPELPPPAAGFTVERSELRARVSHNGNLWLFEQVGSADLFRRRGRRYGQRHDADPRPVTATGFCARAPMPTARCSRRPASGREHQHRRAYAAAERRTGGDRRRAGHDPADRMRGDARRPEAAPSRRAPARVTFRPSTPRRSAGFRGNRLASSDTDRPRGHCGRLRLERILARRAARRRSGRSPIAAYTRPREGSPTRPARPSASTARARPPENTRPRCALPCGWRRHRRVRRAPDDRRPSRGHARLDVDRSTARRAGPRPAISRRSTSAGYTAGRPNLPPGGGRPDARARGGLRRFPGGPLPRQLQEQRGSRGDMVAAVVARHPEWRPLVWGAYGGDPPTVRTAELLDGIKTWSRRSLIDCLLQYEGLGWTGFVPEPCRDTAVMLPINIAPFVWGWPNLFLTRMRRPGAR